ncbi:MAG: ankyrin repeat domain-containing protein [Balneolales bacterium]|nr:ankyrin repeat domain-containing protein [Balneolales bacterium]
MHDAIKRGDLEYIKNAINSGISINLTNSDNFGSLLSLAVIHNKIKIVKFLIAQKANINQVDNSHSSPFIIAAARGHLDILKLLYENNADINLKCEYGRNALIWAAFSANSHQDIIKQLLKWGIDINSKDSDGNNALFWALYRRNYILAKYLIEAGIDIDSKNFKGVPSARYILNKTKHENLSPKLREQFLAVKSAVKA